MWTVDASFKVLSDVIYGLQMGVDMNHCKFESHRVDVSRPRRDCGRLCWYV